MKIFKRLFGEQSGFILPVLISFIVAAVILTGAVLEIIDTNLSIVNNNVQSQKAFNIAEAGINYYLWHLSHNSNDYFDGTGSCTGTPKYTPAPSGCGGYVHNYLDDNAIIEGTFTLYIQAQGGGSTIANVRSVGQVKGTNIIRTVQAQIGAASFASYGVVSDSALWFGNTESATGPVHSNQGVRMDGANSDVVSANNLTYTPAFQNGGCGGSNCSHPGVWCDSTILSPVNCNTRSKTDWLFPTPTVDFAQVTSSLCTMKQIATANNAANACTQTPAVRTAGYLPQRCVSGSGNSCSFSTARGYLIELNSNGTYNLYNVNAEDDTKATYTLALAPQLVASNIIIPLSGVIFAEDNVWVRSNPTYHGRVTIGAGRLAQANNNANIVVASPLAYSTKNGSDAIGLVAEDSIYIAPYAPPAPGGGAFNFEVDGALLAESGSVTFGERGNFSSNAAGYRLNPARCVKGWTNANQTFTFYGSVATRQTWTWTWLVGNQCGDSALDPVNGYISGIENNNTQYDYNLLYGPPPSYPITSGYNIISWREVLTHP